MNKDRDQSGAGGSMNPDPIDRYRQASAELGERPAASVRASILAAAAREVGAGPVDATRPRVRTRWPLAAAATVMLSTLAVMLAIRTQEEMPQFGAAPKPARAVADNAAPPAKIAQGADTAVAPGAAPESRSNDSHAPLEKTASHARTAPPAQPAPPAQAAPLPMADAAPAKPAATASTAADAPPRERQFGRLSAESGPAPAPTERPAAFAKDQSAAVTQAAREADRPALAEAPAAAADNKLEQSRQNVPATAPASPPPEPALRAKQRTEQAAGAAVQTPPVDRTAEVRRDAAPAAAPAPVAAAQSARKPAEESERKQSEEPAAAWLERIIKLRREGRHDEADAELKRFRERYPQVQPPAEALAPPVPAGTR